LFKATSEKKGITDGESGESTEKDMCKKKLLSKLNDI